MIVALEWLALLPYLTVYSAAIVEGEVVFIGASVMVGAGKLNAMGVLIAAALGGSTGDQFVYYALRGRLEWVARQPRFARRHKAVVGRVKRHGTMIILLSRFLPGLRIAIPAACAYAGVSALKFSSLNLASAFAWATSVLVVTAWVGPATMKQLGLPPWLALLASAALLGAFIYWLGHVSKEEIEGG